MCLLLGTLASDTGSAGATGRPPQVELDTLVPGDQRNTVHREQPLAARFTEADREHVDPASITFRLTDGDTGVTTTFDGDDVQYDAATGVARSTPATLEPEHRYEVVLTAADGAGTAQSTTWTFRSMTIEASEASASISGSEGTRVGDDGENAAWEFVPQLDLGRFTVTASPTAHSGYGPIGHDVPLGAARVEFSLPGQPEGTRLSVPAYAPDKTVTAYKQYVQFREDPQRTKTMQASAVFLEPVTVSLPALATDAVLELDVLKAPASIPAFECPDPFVGAPGCDPDALRFFMAEDFALDLLAKQQRGQAISPAAVPDVFVGLAQYLCGTADPETGRCKLPVPHWAPLDPDTWQRGDLPRAPAEPAVFATPGSYQWIVPPDVRSVEVAVRGGVGGGLPGFFGAATTQHATLSVSPNQVLDIVVGGAGRDGNGGYGGGGNGGTGVIGPCCGGGGNGYGGGGASRVTRSGAHLVVGAGGGGQGGGGTTSSTSLGVPSAGATTQGGTGGDAGAPAVDGGRGSSIPGNWPGGFGGRAGGASAGGAGGSGIADPDGVAGGSLVGGRGGNASAPGSGGGGGGAGIWGGGGGEAAWYGGLGGGGGGGGGGRSLGGTTLTAASTVGDAGQDGFVAIVPKETFTTTTSASSLEWQDGQPVADRVEIDGTTFFEGVSYPGDMDIPTPQQFADACAAGYRCVSNDVSMQQAAAAGDPAGGGYQNRDLQRRCLFIDGYNRPKDDCNQEMGAVGVLPYQGGDNQLMAAWVTQLGLADNTTNAPPPDDRMKSPAAVDGFGASWFDDGHERGGQKWSHRPSTTDVFFVQSDWYYHRNDIPQCHRAFAGCTTPIPPTRDVSHYVNVSTITADTSSVQSASDYLPGQGWGYGFKIPYLPTSPLDGNGWPKTSTQYYDACYAHYYTVGNTNCQDQSGNSSWFTGYYNPDSGTRLGPRAGMGRSYGYHVEAKFSGTQSSQAGWFAASYGHKWTEHTVEFNGGWGWDIFPRRSKVPSFSVSFTPKETEKATVTYFVGRYCYGNASC
ncbi:MAG TPA: hypothetical protein VHF47_05715 [Acidimicrobiales bacterium]|nr:hypothetical protein [Acidimicrobiales bacterium]